jgi:hypothetical protein
VDYVCQRDESVLLWEQVGPRGSVSEGVAFRYFLLGHSGGAARLYVMPRREPLSDKRAISILEFPDNDEHSRVCRATTAAEKIEALVLSHLPTPRAYRAGRAGSTPESAGRRCSPTSCQPSSADQNSSSRS